MEINVEVDKKFAGCLKPKLLKSIIAKVLTSMRAGENTEVSLVIAGQQQIHALNKAYLEEDRPTDVLSFPMIEKSRGVFVTPPDGMIHLGDVIVSFPQAVLQAEQHGHPVEREITILLVHGMLHLLGYDHAATADKKIMWDKQDELMNLLEKPAA